MPSDDQDGIVETQITFYRVAGHNHDGENSTRIDFSSYDVFDIIDSGQLKSIIVSTVENAVLKPRSLVVGSGSGTFSIDGSSPQAVEGLTVSSSASATSDGNIFIDASWSGDSDGTNVRYLIELLKSESGSSGAYIIQQSVETRGLSYRFEWIDNESGDGGTVFYKINVYSLSPLGVRSLAASSAAITPAIDSTIPSGPTFNNTFNHFDEGVKATFRGFFVSLNDNTEFDVKAGRGHYEYQVSTDNNPLNGAATFDDEDYLKALGSSKSTYFLVNNLDVRASAGAAKIDYYLRLRSVDSSGNQSQWVYYVNSADGGANGTGSTDITQASAINGVEVDGGVDVLANSITANEILANTITANEIFAGTITATEIATGAITANEVASDIITVGDTIASSNFSSGSAGWQIQASGASDGVAEFNSLTARGTIHANTGTIGGSGGWNIATGLIQSDSGASAVVLGSGATPWIRLGAKTSYSSTGSGIWMDTVNGLVLGSGTSGMWAKTNGTFYLGGASGALQWDGSDLTISGSVTADSGAIGGWSIDSNAIYTGTKDASGYTTSGITLSSSGSIHSKQFYVDSSGNAFFKGNISAINISTMVNDSGFTDDTTANTKISADDVGASGTTVISGARISTGTLNADTINGGTISGTSINIGSGVFQVSSAGEATATSGTIGGWTIAPDAIHTGTKDASGYTTSGITLSSGGSIHSKQFYIDSSGNANFKGTLTAINISTLVNDSGFTDDTTADSAQTTADGKISAADVGASGTTVISGSRITTGTIDANLVTVNNLNADKITSGSISGSKVIGGSIPTSTTISGGSISTGTLNAGAISGGTITGASVNVTGSGESLVVGGSGAGRVTFNQTALVSSAIRFGSSSDDDAYGSLVYGSYSYGGFSFNGVGLYNNAKSAYIVLNNTGSTNPYVYMKSNSNAVLNFSGASSANSDFKIEDGYLTCQKSILAGSTSYSAYGLSTFGWTAAIYGKTYMDDNLQVMGTIMSVGSIMPYTTAYQLGSPPTGPYYGSDLGSSSRYWDDVYARGGVTTSDVSLKENITDASLGLAFIQGLRPVSFTWKEGATGRAGARNHHGFIAQEVEALLGGSAESMALWIDGAYEEEEAWTVEDQNSGEAPEDRTKTVIPAGATQGLRYPEFIAPIVKAIQELSDTIDGIDARLASLEAL